MIASKLAPPYVSDSVYALKSGYIQGFRPDISASSKSVYSDTFI